MEHTPISLIASRPSPASSLFSTNGKENRHLSVLIGVVGCQDNSVVRFLGNDHMVSGSNPPSGKIFEWGASPALCNSRCRNQVV